MPDVTMYRARLENLVNHPRPWSDGREEDRAGGVSPGDAAPEDRGGPPGESGGRKGGSMDQGGFRIAGPTPEELDGLLRIRDLHGFIEQAYRVILHRPPDFRARAGTRCGCGCCSTRGAGSSRSSRGRRSTGSCWPDGSRSRAAGREGAWIRADSASRGPRRRSWTGCSGSGTCTASSGRRTASSSIAPRTSGAGRHALRLRLLPFYSRRRFLEKLQRSEEYRLLLARRLEEYSFELDRERLALERRQWEHERRGRELCGGIDGLLRQALEQQLAAQEQQQARLLGPLAELPAQYAQVLEQLSQVLEAASQHGRRLELQLEAPPRPAPGRRRGTDLALLVEEDPGVDLEAPGPSRSSGSSRRRTG